jgi:hypothetical protein
MVIDIDNYEEAQEEEQNEDNSDSNNGSSDDDSGHVIVTGDPSEGEDVKAVGSGDNRDEALQDAAKNDDYDADSGTDVDRVEQELGTDQAESNPNDYSDGSTKIYEGETGQGNEVEVRKDRIEVGGKTKEITIVGESNPRVDQESSEALEQSLRNDGYNDFADNIDDVQDSSDNTKVVVGSNNQLEVRGFNRNTPDQDRRNQQEQRENRGQNDTIDPSNLQELSDQELREMGFRQRTGAMTAGDQELSMAEKVRLNQIPGKTKTTSPYAVTSLGEEIRAKDRYIQTEFERRPGYTTRQKVARATGDETLGNLAGFAVANTYGAVKDLPETVETAKYAANNPVKFQEELTDRDTYPTRTTSEREFQEFQTDFGIGVSAFSAGAGGVAAGGSVSGITRAGAIDKAAEIAKVKGRRAAARADPATGFGRTRLPGEETPTSPEIARKKAEDFLDFVKGDIEPERRRRPDARGVEIDTNPRLPRKDRESVENTYVKADELNPERDDFVVDSDGNVPVEIYERTRTDVAREKVDAISQEINERMNTGPVGLGPGALLKQKDLETDDKLDSSSTDYITPDDRRTDTRDSFDRNRRDNIDRRRRSERDRPRSRDDYDFDESARNKLRDVAGVNLGISLTDDQDQGVSPFEEQNQGQGQRQEPDQKVEQRPENDTDFIATPDGNDGRRPREEEFYRERRDDNDRNRKRRRDRDYDFDEDTDLNLVGENNEDEDLTELTGEYAPSVAGVLLNIKADETPDTVTGFGIRGVSTNEESDNSDDQEPLSF